jgi:histidinol-phosphate aminotransferase
MPATVPFVAPDALERRAGRSIRLRLGANESVFGVSPKARQAMIDTIDRIAWYADPESFLLRERLAGLLGVRMQNLVVGSGIDDLLGLVVRAFLDPGAPAVTSLGAYPTFNYHVIGYGGALHRVPYRNDCNDLESLTETARRLRARLIYLANPDNPTGTWHTAARIREFLDHTPENCVVLLDEAYMEFAPPADVLPIDADNPRAIRLRTFSKAHGMAGARIGYAVTAPETIAAFDKVRVQFGVNMFAQAGALASLDDPEFIATVVSGVAEGREDYYQLARDLNLPALPSAANFVAMDTGTAENAQFLLKTLFDCGVFIRIPGAPPLDRCIRVTVGSPVERTEFAAVMRSLARDGLLTSEAMLAAGARSS